MKEKKKIFRYEVTPSEPSVMHDAALAEPPSLSVNVRSAKDQLSSLLEHAASGNEVIITSDGQPKARLTSVRSQRRPYRVDWAWLRSQPMSGGASAEDLVRMDRDGRW